MSILPGEAASGRFVADESPPRHPAVPLLPIQLLIHQQAPVDQGRHHLRCVVVKRKALVGRIVLQLRNGLHQTRFQLIELSIPHGFIPVLKRVLRQQFFVSG